MKHLVQLMTVSHPDVCSSLLSACEKLTRGETQQEMLGLVTQNHQEVFSGHLLAAIDGLLLGTKDGRKYAFRGIEQMKRVASWASPWEMSTSTLVQHLFERRYPESLLLLEEHLLRWPNDMLGLKLLEYFSFIQWGSSIEPRLHRLMQHIDPFCKGMWLHAYLLDKITMRGSKQTSLLPVEQAIYRNDQAKHSHSPIDLLLSPFIAAATQSASLLSKVKDALCSEPTHVKMMWEQEGIPFLSSWVQGDPTLLDTALQESRYVYGGGMKGLCFFRSSYEKSK